ncbi:MAG TPA: regulatory protein RecX [Jatrophihabitans sp.]|nr:regulatory protein RecX [Jatrophihabitans sp.]
MARQRPAQHRDGSGGTHLEPPDHLLADPDADPESVARTICLRLLTARARTRAELAEALDGRGIPRDTADRVLDRLIDVGLVDDRAFAEQFVVARHQDRGLACRELARQLRDKGVEDSVIADAVSGLDSEQEIETGRRLVERKLRSMARLEPAVQTRRLVGMLARKGYSPGLAFQIVRDFVGAEPDETGPETAWLA